MRKPLYATKSRIGNLYTVVFESDEHSTESRSSYSDRVLEPYRGTGLPLLDYQASDSNALIDTHRQFLGVREATVKSHVTEENELYYPTFDDFMDRCKKSGVVVTTI